MTTISPERIAQIVALRNLASPAKAGAQQRAARNWAPAFAGEAVEMGGGK